MTPGKSGLAQRVGGALALFLLLCQPGPLWAAPIKIKIATVLPPGSPISSALSRLASEVRRKTKGQVIFRIYFGATAGGETRAVQRLRRNQVQGLVGGSVSIGMIEPSSRILELPLLFKSEREFDFVARSMHKTFVARAKARGYRILILLKAGWVYFFSKRPVKSLADLRRLKCWRWKGDRVNAVLMRGLGIKSQALPVADVLPSLQSGIIDSAYGFGHAVHALQWHTSVRHALNLRIAMAIGGLVVREDAFARLTPAHQKILVDSAAAAQRRMNPSINRLNRRSFKLMLRSGVKRASLPPSIRAAIPSMRTRIWKSLAGVSYRPADLTRVRALIALCRSTACKI